jgi:hypothetical protein
MSAFDTKTKLEALYTLSWDFRIWPAVCTENPIRVYRMIESAKLAR